MQKGIQPTTHIHKLSRNFYDHGKRNEALTTLDAAVENGIDDEETRSLLKEYQKVSPAKAGD